MEKVTCFLPCRSGSQRVVKKNIKPFSSFKHGLIEIKLRQLLAAKMIDEVVLTTNDTDIIDFAESLKDSRIRLHHRVEVLSSSKTSTDQLVAHALELIPNGQILWTHVTSPFINEKIYDHAIKTYFQHLESGYDSLMSVTPIHGFLWQDEKPINYDRRIEKWPRTQTLEVVQEVNSGIFIACSSIYENLNDRIGKKPHLYELDKITSFDIDWPEDFAIAECIADKKLANL
jgi:CMP-N-acetylneuraminic acid synthetase